MPGEFLNAYALVTVPNIELGGIRRYVLVLPIRELNKFSRKDGSNILQSSG